MSAFSTIHVTRTAARKYLLGQVMDATDSELEGLINDFLAERLYEAIIVPDDSDGVSDDLLD